MEGNFFASPLQAKSGVEVFCGVTKQQWVNGGTGRQDAAAT